MQNPPLGSVIDRLQSYKLHIPNEAECPECGYFDLDYEGVREALVERGYSEAGGGRNLSMAACRCPEIERQKRSELADRLKESDLPQGDHTFASFEKREGTEAALEAAAKMVTGEGPPILVIEGVVGTGKSHILEAVGRRTLEFGRRVRYMLVPADSERMRATQARDSAEVLYDLIKNWEAGSILLMDDLGLRPETEWGMTQLFTIIDERYRNNRRLVITTNIGSREAMESFCGARVADRLYDEATGKVRRVSLTCESYPQGEG